jgi:hypothetical protein
VTRLLDNDERSIKQQKDAKLNRTSQKRFGFSVRFDQYRTSNLIKVICITLAIIIIPLEIFVQHVLQDNEGDMIISLQQSFGNSETLQWFMRLPLILVRPQVTCLFMCLLYLSSDSLLAFKVSSYIINMDRVRY